jgi:hypothetical protein
MVPIFVFIEKSSVSRKTPRFQETPAYRGAGHHDRKVQDGRLRAGTGDPGTECAARERQLPARSTSTRASNVA